MVFSLVLTLSSCDEFFASITGGEENSDNTEKPDNEKPDNEKPEEETPAARTTITAEEWIALEEAYNFSFDVDMIMTQKSSTGESASMTYDVVYNMCEYAGYACIKTVMKNPEGEELKGENEMYLMIKDGKYYDVYEEDGKYYGYEIQSGSMSLSQLLASMQISFNGMTYDEAKGAYKSGGFSYNGMPCDLYIYFADGLPTKIEANGVEKLEDDGEEIDISISLIITVYDVGATAVELPEITIVGSEEGTEENRTTMTEEEFEEFFSMENFTLNLDVEYTVPGYPQFNGSGSGYIKYDGDKRAELSFDEEKETLYVEIDGVEYILYEEDGVYYATPHIENDEDSPLVPSDWTDFVYDSEECAYIFRGTEGENSASWKIYCENGQVVEMVVLYQSVSDGILMNMYLEISFADIGTTVVELPEFILEGDDGETEVRKTITEEEWNYHSEISNFTVYTSVYYTVYDSEGEIIQEQSTTSTIASTDYAYVEVISPDEYTIWACQDGVWYRLTEDEDGNYIGTPDDECPAIDDPENDLDLEFDDLVYNEELEVYEAVVDMNGISITYWFEFENGVAVSVLASSDQTVDEGYIMNVTVYGSYSNVNETEINVPEFVIAE